MASQIEICNWALDHLGERHIDDINDDAPRARLLLAAWGPVRDAALRARWWKFSIARDSLAADATAPAWGYTLRYALAGDVVRVIQVGQFYPDIDLSDYRNGSTAPFAIEGRYILTDMAAPLKVRWILNSIDVGLWDASFAKLMACDLAERLAPRLTESMTWKDAVKRDRREALSEAVRANALESPPDDRADGSWIASRFAV